MSTTDVNPLIAPFPWFGGKARIADVIWERFGDVDNYCEPFAGSLAVLLARPHEPRIETVNDKDRHIANFWRSVQADPDGVTIYADQPVHECNLEAQHYWLITEGAARLEKLLTDPDAYDVKCAGWWVAGQCAWIGSGGNRTSIAQDVRAWAIENAGNPDLRIALCGYDGQFEMPNDWTVEEWKAAGGYSSTASGETEGKKNRHRERVWFSRNCIRPDGYLFGASA